jgi:hypothetical protein
MCSSSGRLRGWAAIAVKPGLVVAGMVASGILLVDLGIVIDREEDAVRVRLPPVRQNWHPVIGIDTLGRNGTPLRILVE